MKSVQINFLFLVRIFLYLDWIQENTDQKKLPIWTLLTQSKLLEPYHNSNTIFHGSIMPSDWELKNVWNGLKELPKMKEVLENVVLKEVEPFLITEIFAWNLCRTLLRFCSTKNGFFSSFIPIYSFLQWFPSEHVKDTLMYIWKFAYIFVFIWKKFVEDFTIKHLLLF